MAAIYQIQASWAGASVVGPATTTFYTDSDHAAAAQQAVATFFNAIVQDLPSTVTVTTPNTGQIYDDVTGAVQGTWQAGTVVNSVGQGIQGFSAASGALLRLGTGTTVGRRILRGHVFLVPLGGAAYTANGTLSAATQQRIATAAATMITDSGDFLFKIWHRPKSGAGGLSAYVSSTSVPTKVAVLTSRRQ